MRATYFDICQSSAKSYNYSEFFNFNKNSFKVLYIFFSEFCFLCNRMSDKKNCWCLEDITKSMKNCQHSVVYEWDDEVKSSKGKILLAILIFIYRKIFFFFWKISMRIERNLFLNRRFTCKCFKRSNSVEKSRTQFCARQLH